jgi:phage terminase large subunit-like protein
MNSINRYKGGWRIVVVGTILHQDSLLERLLSDPNWESVRLEICDDNFNSNWEEGISRNEIINLYTSYKDQGLPDVFYREYRNNPVPIGDDAVFSDKMFKVYDENEEKLWTRDIENVVLCDPAKSNTVNSAESAIVVWGVDLHNRRFYLRDIVRGKLNPNEIYKTFVDKCIEFGVRVAGVETAGLEEHILYPIKNEMMSRGVFFELISLMARRGKAEYSGRGKGKEARVAGLVPLYRNGEVYHNKTIAHLIESQLLGFPRAKFWDVMDCAAYLPIVLDEHYSYFYREDYAETEAEVEEEYAELLNEEEMEMEDWI